VPLTGWTCGRCGRNGRSIDLSPPGDVRLALGGTRKRIRYLFLRQFGVQQLIPDIFVLNKSSGEDRAEEIIVDGRRIALLAYDLQKRDYKLTLRVDGARMLAHENPKKVIRLKKAEGHLKGNYLPKDAVASFDPGIRAGDEVIVEMGKFIGCASAKVNASELRTSDKGVRIRDFTQYGPLRPGKRAYKRDLIRANFPHLAARKAKAEHELRQTFASSKKPITVSFSGGKDSLVILDLVSSVTKDFTAIYIDTGLEHPETRTYVKKLASDRGFKLMVASAEDAFDESFPTFGPPAKDFRWCCKVCKLAPVSEIIQKEFKEGTMTVEGNRRLESFSRGRIELVGENPFVPGQTVVNPIRDWTALDVWLHIIWRDLPYNPLYDEDIERIGCWMCPSSLESEYVDISRLSPDLAKGWQNRLDAWAEKNELPKEFVRHGFWRWKELPPKMKTLAEQLKIQVKPRRADTLSIHVIKGVSPCTSGGYSVEAVLETPQAVGLGRIAELLKTVGDVKLVEDFGVAMVRSERANAKVFAGGQVSSIGKTSKDATEFFDKVARAVLRADMCTKCGICVRTCPSKAITLSLTDGIQVDETKCNICGKCAESCVVAHYFDKLAGEITAKESVNRKSM